METKDIDKYVEEGVKNFLSKFNIDSFKTMNPEIERIKIELSVFPITVDSNGYVFIPTGTPEKPAGLRNYEGEAIVISDFKNLDPIFTSKSDLRNAMIENKEDFSNRRMNEDFSIIGIYVEFEKLKEILESK